MKAVFNSSQALHFLRQYTPETIDELIQKADVARAGRLILPGTGNQPFFVGAPPLWNTNPTNDDEYIWGLNRMYHWPLLLRAELLTGDISYGNQVLLELDDWIQKCPRPPINTDPVVARQSFYACDAWRSLEAGIRLFDTWPFVQKHFANDERFTPDLASRFKKSVHEHAEVLAEICPVFWPKADHNHYLMENLGLLSATVMFPDDPFSARWRTHAIRELERCAEMQLTEDGGQIEGCPTYHNGCIYWFCLALLYAPKEMSAGYRERVHRGLHYTVHSFRPSGTCVPAGDSDALDSATSAALWWHLVSGDAEPLLAVVDIIGPEKARAKVAEHAWVLPDPEAVLRLVEAPHPRCAFPTVHHQKKLEQVMIRTGWDREALSVFFHCKSPVENAHAHCDPAGFDFTALGRPLLVDPARFTYRDDEDRRHFKSAMWHNTVTVDDRDPYYYGGSFWFGKQHEGRITGVWERPGVVSAASMQRNFAPAIHRRLVALIDGQWLLVLDAFSGLWDEATVQIHYHVDSTQVSWKQEKHLFSAVCGDVGLELVTSPTLAGSFWGTRVSEVFDDSHPAKRLKLEDQSGLTERVFAAVAVPYRLGTNVPRPGVKVEPTGVGDILCHVQIGTTRQVLCWGANGLFRD